MWVRANGECYVEQHSCSKKSPSVDFYKMRFSCSWFPEVFWLTVEIWKMCSSFHRLFLHRSCGPRPPWGRLALTDSSPPTSSTKQSMSKRLPLQSNPRVKNHLSSPFSSSVGYHAIWSILGSHFSPFPLNNTSVVLNCYKLINAAEGNSRNKQTQLLSDDRSHPGTHQSHHWQVSVKWS